MKHSIIKNSKAQDQLIQDILDFIGDDSQWVAELYNVVNDRTELFFKHSELSTFEDWDATSPKFTYLKNSFSFIIFFLALLRIYESHGINFLDIDLNKIRKKIPKGFIGVIDDDIQKDLNKSAVDKLLNEFFMIAGLFIGFIKDDRQYSFKSYSHLLDENRILKNELRSVLSEGVRRSAQSNNTQETKPIKSGRPPKFKDKESLLRAVNAIPNAHELTQTDLSKKLGYKSESGLRGLLNKFEISFEELFPH